MSVGGSPAAAPSSHIPLSVAPAGSCSSDRWAPWRAGRQSTGLQSTEDNNNQTPHGTERCLPELTSLWVPSSSASRGGGITMERLGGFLLCRRLLLERLLPFLLLDAILRGWQAAGGSRE